MKGFQKQMPNGEGSHPSEHEARPAQRRIQQAGNNLRRELKHKKIQYVKTPNTVQMESCTDVDDGE